MGLYRRGKTWWLTFSSDGRRVSVSSRLTDRRLADRWAAAYRAEVECGRRDPFLRNDVNVGVALTRYRRIHLRVNRPASYANSAAIFANLRRFFWKTRLRDARSRLDEYRAQRRATVSSATVNKDIRFLKAACAKAFEWNLVPDNFMRGYKLDRENNQRTRFIEDEEFFRLLDASRDELVPILVVARHTGMRQGELLGLKWTDVDLQRGVASLRMTKSGEGRVVPLSTDVIAILERIVPARQEGYVFRRVSHDRIRRQQRPDDGSVALNPRGWLMHAFRRAVRRAGLVDFHFHDLRHTWASHAAMRGADVQTLAAVLGHKTLRMTQRYTHLSAAHLKSTVEIAAPRRPATKALQSTQFEAAPTAYKNKILAISSEDLNWCPQRESNPCYHLESQSTEGHNSEVTCANRRRYNVAAN